MRIKKKNKKNVLKKLKSPSNSEFFPEKLPKPSLNALPGPVVEHSAKVTLKCHCHFQNMMVMLGKSQDPGYKQEQSSAGYDAEFLLTDLEPKRAGTYFCACKTMVSHKWSEKSEPLQLVTSEHGRLRFPSWCTYSLFCDGTWQRKKESRRQKDGCDISGVGKRRNENKTLIRAS